MLRILAGAVVIVGLLAQTELLVADPPQFLYGFCLVPQDRVQRATERDACNDFAQLNGFVRGVIRPFECPPGQECEEPEECEAEEGAPVPQPYMCTGVGRP